MLGDSFLGPGFLEAQQGFDPDSETQEDGHEGWSTGFFVPPLSPNQRHPELAE